GTFIPICEISLSSSFFSFQSYRIDSGTCNSRGLWDHSGSDMAFLVTSLIFAVVGIIASIFTRICFNQGPSTNLLHFTLVITATVCCWMM
ncbi:unnamed protein product, partial [Brassica napus]